VRAGSLPLDFLLTDFHTSSTTTSPELAEESGTPSNVEAVSRQRGMISTAAAKNTDDSDTDSVSGADDTKNHSEYQPHSSESDSITSDDNNVRRSPINTREREKLLNLLSDTLIASSELTENEPDTVNDALNCRDRMHWKQAMKEEIESFNKNKVFTLVDLPAGAKKVTCRWVFKIKKNALGQIERYKARLVARGFSQRPGVDYDSSYAPVMRMTTLKLLIAYATEMSIDYADVQCAYLNGDLTKPVYMEQPDGYYNGNPNQVLLLKKAIYGLPDAGRAWYDKLSKQLIELGFTRLEVEPCIFFFYI